MADPREREERKARMQMSAIGFAAENGSREYLPVSSTPLDRAYQTTKSPTRSAYLDRIESSKSSMHLHGTAPADKFVAAKHMSINRPDPGLRLGYDPTPMDPSNTAYGLTADLPPEQIDLLQSVPKMRDTTLDGAHRASMTERHMLNIWDPYASQHKIRSASFYSAGMLRDSMHKHTRSQYNPDEKYVLPPTVQNEIGWGLDLARYRDSCAKFQEGAEWHGRSATITSFSERLLLGARHHLSGPMTNPKLHY